MESNLISKLITVMVYIFISFNWVTNSYEPRISYKLIIHKNISKLFIKYNFKSTDINHHMCDPYP